MDIIFFSKGRGCEFAIQDIALGGELRKLRQNWRIFYASYAAGAIMLRKKGVEYIDLRLPDNNAFLDTVDRSIAVIREKRPGFVICHEEPGAVYAAHVMNVPALYIATWLPAAAMVGAEALAYCSSVIVLGHPGIIQVPKHVRVKPIFVGPIQREMAFKKSHKSILRREYGIGEHEFVVLGLPGDAMAEDRTPLFELVVAAFISLLVSEKWLYWVSARDFKGMGDKVKEIPGVVLMDIVDPIEKIMAVADIIITKGSYSNTVDAAMLGVPSISIAFGENSGEDGLVSRINTNLALNAKALSSDVLAFYIKNHKGCEYLPLYSDTEGCVPGANVGRIARTICAEVDRFASV